jgi:hypothetical protein
MLSLVLMIGSTAVQGGVPFRVRNPGWYHEPHLCSFRARAYMELRAYRTGPFTHAGEAEVARTIRYGAGCFVESASVITHVHAQGARIEVQQNRDVQSPRVAERIRDGLSCDVFCFVSDQLAYDANRAADGQRTTSSGEVTRQLRTNALECDR